MHLCINNKLYKRGQNTVIAFSWRDCAKFLFVNTESSTVFHVLAVFWFLFYLFKKNMVFILLLNRNLTMIEVYQSKYHNGW